LWEAGIILVASMSHTALDFLTGYKTLWPGVPPAGLQLYRWPVLEYLLELSAVAVGWRKWRAAIPAEARRSEPVWLMVAMLFVAQTAVMVGVVLFGSNLASDGMSKFVR
jgi:hypothetical protein